MGQVYIWREYNRTEVPYTVQFNDQPMLFIDIVVAFTTLYGLLRKQLLFVVTIIALATGQVFDIYTSQFIDTGNASIVTRLLGGYNLAMQAKDTGKWYAYGCNEFGNLVTYSIYCVTP